MARKVTGSPVFTSEGLEVFVNQRQAKRHGRDRVWIQIRQSGDKKQWERDVVLIYVNGADICFKKR